MFISITINQYNYIFSLFFVVVIADIMQMLKILQKKYFKGKSLVTVGVELSVTGKMDKRPSS